MAAVRFTTEEFCNAAERRGLSVNIAVEKTEALLVLRRAGKNKVKDDLKGRNTTIHVAVHEPRVVEWYRHMGSMCTPSGAMGFEVSWRVGRTRAAYHVIAGHFFGLQPAVQEERGGCNALGDAPSLQQRDAATAARGARQTS